MVGIRGLSAWRLLGLGLGVTVASASRRLRRSVAAGGLDSGLRRRVAWLGVLAREARVPNAMLVRLIDRHDLADVARWLKARRAELRRKAAARDKVRGPWVTVESGNGTTVKISRVPRRPHGAPYPGDPIRIEADPALGADAPFLAALARPHTWTGGGPTEPPRCEHCPAPFLPETPDDCPGPKDPDQ